MSIRLIRASKNLNVGISSLVDFLQKKGVEIEANPNAKLEDEHYDLLVSEFAKDEYIKKEAEESNRKYKKEKEEKEAVVAIEGYEKKDKKSSIKTEVPEDLKPKVNIISKIDLDKPSKKTVEVKSEKENEPIVPKEEIKIISEEPKAEPIKDIKKEEEILTVAPPKDVDLKKEQDLTPAQAETSNEETSQEKEVITLDSKEEKKESSKKEKPVEVKQVTPETETIPEKENESSEDIIADDDDDVFRYNSAKIKSHIVVKGTIDLAAINDKTRPAKKTKAQRAKERQDKELENKKSLKPTVTQTTPPATQSAEELEKRKRKRIRKGKVNIDKPTDTPASETVKRKNKLVLKKPIKTAVNEEDVQKQVKETLARLTEKRGGKGGAKYRREKREAVSQRNLEELEQLEQESRILQLTEFVTANDLANMMNIPVTQVISTCMSLGVMVAINQRLDAETINIVAEEFNFKTKYVSVDVTEAITEEEDKEEDLLPRPPIVTVMGHVDHGKTSLLDNIRKTNVIAGEAGGITQHIGAYNVKLSDGKKITFLDTPGHEAFTAMRARGAKVTDVAIIIVAADDNVMPQTKEAINHAAAANVPIVFAINKIDKPGANAERIKEELATMNYLVEEWGGKYQSQDISAKKGDGLQDLLEKVILESDMLELKANPNRKATGSVIESSLDKGRGYVATVLVQNGTLKHGDIVIAGSYFGRVKAMFNERNQRVEQAGPSEPVLLLGLNGAPQAGDTFNVMDSEQEARAITGKREQLQREQSIRTQKLLTLDDIGRRIAIGNFQQLNVIVKGDVDGSVEALADSLIQLSTEEIQVNVIHKGVGQISESDITLAAASDAIVIGFQVRPSLTARREAEKEGVDIRLYSIIYDAIEEVKSAMEGMLSPDIKEEIVANVEVHEVFKISKVGTIAGCIVKEGKIKRSNKVRVIRDGIVTYTGELDSLKRFKDDVKEVGNGYECGLSIRNYSDIQVGDFVEAFEEIEVKKTL